MRIIQPENKIQDGSFSNTTFAHDGYKGVLFNLERQVIHNLSFVINISESHIFKFNISLHIIYGLSSFCYHNWQL